MSMLVNIVFWTMIGFCFFIFIFIGISSIIFAITGFNTFDYIDEKVKKRKENRFEILEEKLKAAKIEIQRNKLEKYSKKNESLLVSALRYEYFEYVKIVEEILDEICDRTKVETNDLYLTKLNQNFRKIDADIYDISGMACFYNAIIEYPVINEVNEKTMEINKNFIKKIMEYTFFNEYHFCVEKKISVYDKRKELYEYVRELIN